MDEDQYIVAIELGSSDIKILIGAMDDTNTMEIVGSAKVVSREIDKAVINNHEFAFEDFGEALNKAYKEAGLEELSNITLAISGDSISTEDYKSTMSMERPREVTNSDLISLLSKARQKIETPRGSIAVSVTDKKIILDKSRPVPDPVRLKASLIDYSCLAVFADANIAETAEKLIHDTMLHDSNYINFSGFGSLRGATTIAEQREGVLVIDIGAQITDYVFVKPGSFCEAGTLAVGGDHICNDISMAFNLDFKVAKDMYFKHASAISRNDGRERMLETPSGTRLRKRRIPHSSLEQVVELRLREVFSYIRQKVSSEGVHLSQASRVVLTGGVSRLENIAELAADIFEVESRTGKLEGFEGPEEVLSDPAFSTCAGMLLLGQQSYFTEVYKNETFLKAFKETITEIYRSIMSAFRI